MYARTAREEILNAFAALDRCHGREEHTVMEVLEEVRRQGGEHPDSTIRTHVVSVMCVNAPRNHAIRYDDLERVRRGTYRLRR